MWQIAMEWDCIKCGATLRGPGPIPPPHDCRNSGDPPGTDRGRLAVLVGAVSGVGAWVLTGSGEAGGVAAIVMGVVALTRIGAKLIGWTLLAVLAWWLLA